MAVGRSRGYCPPGIGLVTKEIKRVISGKRSHSQRTRHMRQLALPQSGTWPWRFASLLMLALLATILLPRPDTALAAAIRFE